MDDGGPATAAAAGTWAIVLAAGRGERFGAPKQFLPLAGETLVERSVAAVSGVCDGVVVTVPPGTDLRLPGARTVVGGSTRAASVRAGLAAVPEGVATIVIHDAAHPLATPDLVARVVAAVEAGADGAVPVVAMTETVVRVDGGVLGDVVPRAGLALVQMPHAFRAAVLRRAHAPGPDVSDEATLLRQLGLEVIAVPGEATNLHVTTPDELRLTIAAHDLAG